MHRVLIALVALWHICSFAVDGAPRGANCNLSSPPASAGEESNHGIVLRIYPRAKDIDSRYTGCQALLAPDGERWAVVSLTEVVEGDPVRVWSPHEPDAAVLACRFRNGKVVQGNPGTCPAPEFLLVKSMEPGCVEVIREAVAKQGLGASRPARCEYR
jgi:hypothetical protein